jgi:hypothetical protein
MRPGHCQYGDVTDEPRCQSHRDVANDLITTGAAFVAAGLLEPTSNDDMVASLVLDEMGASYCTTVKLTGLSS